MQGLLTAHARHLHLLYEHLQLDLLRLLAARQGTRVDGLEKDKAPVDGGRRCHDHPGYFEGARHHLRICGYRRALLTGHITA
eukprot:COSAG06_NODE_11313_length_1529_cov_93.725175_3_plen_82_part_00